MNIIKYPQKGRFSPDGVLVEWKKNEGDAVKKGDLLALIEAAGERLEIESGIDGILLKQVAAAGRFVKSGAPLAILGQKGEDISSVLANLQKEIAPDTVTKARPKAEKQTQKIEKEQAMASESTENPDNVIPLLMPQAGQSMEEGTILSWKVKEGDTIEVGQVIMEIETDKATMEVEAVDAGRVAKIVAHEGDIVEVKKPVAYLADEGVNVDVLIGAEQGPAQHEKAVAQEKQQTEPVSAHTKKPVVTDASGRVKASPAARKAAQEKGVDLSTIGSGSGPHGRIILTDVEQTATAPTGAKSYSLSKMRKAIARNLSYSKQTIPHFYAKVTVDATSLFATYRKTRERFKCSVNDFVTAACAKAIRLHPAFRSQFNDSEIIEQPAVNIGIAVGTEEGLTVPVVLNTDRMKLEQLAARTREVVESARDGKLEGTGQGIFTITNLGMFGVEEFQAIINPPESAILAVGAIREGVIVENGAIRPGRLMTMTLSVDHRVIDGVLAARFLKTLKELLENPEQLR